MSPAPQRQIFLKTIINESLSKKTTCISFNETINSIMNSVDCIPTVNAVPNKRPHCSIHSASGSSNVNNSQSVATLQKRKEKNIEID